MKLDAFNVMLDVYVCLSFFFLRDLMRDPDNAEDNVLIIIIK